MTQHALPDWHSTFSAHAEPATATVRTRGDLDLLTLEVLRGSVEMLVLSGKVDITIDLAELGSVDHAGLLMLGGLAHDLDYRGGSLTLANPRPAVRQSLEAACLPTRITDGTDTHLDGQPSPVTSAERRRSARTWGEPDR